MGEAPIASPSATKSIGSPSTVIVRPRRISHVAVADVAPVEDLGQQAQQRGPAHRPDHGHV